MNNNIIDLSPDFKGSYNADYRKEAGMQPQPEDAKILAERRTLGLYL